MNKDESGKPIFLVKVTEDGMHEFFPYNIGTIHEYIKSKQEMDQEKETDKKCGAV